MGMMANPRRRIERMVADGPAAQKLRVDIFKQMDYNGNNVLSLAEIDSFVQVSVLRLRRDWCASVIHMHVRACFCVVGVRRRPAKSMVLYEQDVWPELSDPHTLMRAYKGTTSTIHIYIHA